MPKILGKTATINVTACVPFVQVCEKYKLFAHAQMVHAQALDEYSQTWNRPAMKHM